MILRLTMFLVAMSLSWPAFAQDRITVFAASSLKTVLDRVAGDWTAAGGAPLVLSYAGTPVLARQIEEGAPADLFFAASEDWMDRLEAAGLIRAGTRRDLLGNRLVLVRHGPGPVPVVIGSGFDLAGLLGEGRLAMALTQAVPAGIYGREALTALGLWDGVSAQVAEADNVRAALALVALGEAPLGIVYATDAGAEAGVSVVGTFPDGSHAPIRYPVAVTEESGHPDAERFLEFLTSEPAAAVFASEGFIVLEAP